MIRPYKIEDCNDIIDIAKCIKSNFIDIELLESIIDDKNYLLLVDYEEEVRGFVYLSISFDQADIYDIAIKEKYRRKHIATNLINSITSFNNDIKELFLEVRASNLIAIKLYESLNFKQYLIRKNYYGDEDALCMKKIIKEGEL